MSAPMLRFLTLEEAVVVEILSERVFPETAEGPGASEAGVAMYIDQQLAGPWGQGERLYQEPPFARPEHEGHGWQSELTPAQAYRYALAVLERHCAATYERAFVELSDDEVDALLIALESDEIDAFLELRGSEFLDMFLENVAEGLFGDPSYGGNRNCIGWKWIGFPGDPDRYGEPYSQHFGDPGSYVVEPKGLAANS